jgi:hypothetical protein
MILAEKSLSHYKAKGLVDRTFSFHCRPGKVKYSIKEVVSENISKSPGLHNQFKEILDFRKLLLLYRLLHYKDPLSQIEIGLKNRDNELCKPLLQLFYGTKALEEIIPALEEFVKQRKERKANSLEAALYPIIKDLLNYSEHAKNDKNTIIVYFADIWNEIIDGGIEGVPVHYKNNEFDTLDYGIVYKNTLSKLIADKFGAKIGRKPKGSIITFDLERFERFDKIYGTDNSNTKSNEVQIVVKLVTEETVDDLSGIDNNQLLKVDKYEETSNNEKRIDIHESSEDFEENISIGNVCINKCVGSDTILKDENNRTQNEGSLENSVGVNEESVDNVGNVGISERVSTNIIKKENEILTDTDSMKDNSQNNNLPIFNYNYNKNKINSLSTDDKKRNTHPLEPTLPTLSSAEKELSTLSCPYCDYKGIEVDLGVHMFEKHRYYLKQLERDSSDLNIRTDYLVEQIKLQQTMN